MVDEKIHRELITRALSIRQKAYAPYSKYHVGAALLTTSGKIYEGINIENSAFPVTVCAERVAVFKAVSEGERSFQAIVVATQDGGSPCGSCRQVMFEFAPQMQVLTVDEQGKVVLDVKVKDLLPYGFSMQEEDPN